MSRNAGRVWAWTSTRSDATSFTPPASVKSFLSFFPDLPSYCVNPAMGRNARHTSRRFRGYRSVAERGRDRGHGATRCAIPATGLAGWPLVGNEVVPEPPTRSLACEGRDHLRMQSSASRWNVLFWNGDLTA